VEEMLSQSTLENNLTKQIAKFMIEIVQSSGESFECDSNLLRRFLS
jgi:hypothetical protein